MKDTTGNKSVSRVELRQRTRSTSGDYDVGEIPQFIKKSINPPKPSSSEIKDATFLGFGKAHWIYRRALLLTSLFWLGICLLISSTYLWPSYYCLDEVLGMSDVTEYPDQTPAKMENFIYLMVDSIPSFEVQRSILPILNDYNDDLTIKI